MLHVSGRVKNKRQYYYTSTVITRYSIADENQVRSRVPYAFLNTPTAKREIPEPTVAIFNALPGSCAIMKGITDDDGGASPTEK